MQQVQAADVATIMEFAKTWKIASISVSWNESETSAYMLVELEDQTSSFYFYGFARTVNNLFAESGRHQNVVVFTKHGWCNVASITPRDIQHAQKTGKSLSEFVLDTRRPNWGEPAEDDSQTWPVQLRCSYTDILMYRPVIAADGYSYDIASWLYLMKEGMTTSPVTGDTLEHRRFVRDDACAALLCLRRAVYARRPICIRRALRAHLVEGVAGIVVAYLYRRPFLFHQTRGWS